MANNFSRAFTFIELLVVMIVIGILASIAYPVYTGVLERAKITKDMNNLRQVGLATQTYMNDNDGTLFSTTGSWMSQLNPKYTAAWGIFQSPFDTRSPSEAGIVAPVSPISYGINGTAGLIGMAADKITKPTVFILFAPAEAAGATVSFQGLATDVPGPTVLGIGGGSATTPGGPATAGTYSNRKRVSALFADLHAETMDWTTFTNNAATANDPDGELRWKPYIPYP
jgi:prepilin-type N-terminal cleavage/methylation domain-containing protein